MEIAQSTRFIKLRTTLVLQKLGYRTSPISFYNSNRGCSGQASAWITDYPTFAKPLTLYTNNETPTIKKPL